MGIRDAIKELEARLADRLEATADRLPAWLKERGYVLLDVETKSATVNVGKNTWMKNKEDAFVYVSVGGLFPFGYRKVGEEHPFVWLMSDGLSEDEQEVFQAEVSNRLEKLPGGWLNKACARDWPAGRYITSHGDPERVKLAQSDESLESFMKAELEPILALGDEFDAAFAAARGAKRSKVKA